MAALRQRIERRAGRALGPAPGRARLLAQGRDAELRGGGRLRGRPVVGLEHGPLSGVGEQGRGELHAADPVGHRVMNAAAEADATVLEARHERELPQRPGAVERLGEQRVDQVVEAAQRHRLVGLGVGDDVAGDVEARVVHPERVAQPRGRIGDPVPAARQAGPGARRSTPAAPPPSDARAWGAGGTAQPTRCAWASPASRASGRPHQEEKAVPERAPRQGASSHRRQR